MRTADVVIVGGGPAGSSCAWRLRLAGLDVLVFDRARFPRDKPCAGWITPPVVTALQLDLAEYAGGRVLQPITGFRTGRMNGGGVETRYDHVVSYGIRRCEFDEYLLRRSGARVSDGLPVSDFRRKNGWWVVGGHVRTPLLVGAGGHFCPVARHLNARATEPTPAVVAQEIEVTLGPGEDETCDVRPEIPELYFCDDLQGYGWCFRKQRVLNVGLGRLDDRQLSRHVRDFVARLRRRPGMAAATSGRWAGHAYLLHTSRRRRIVGEGALLIGDAAGLAYPASGEGIRTAVESGLIAAETILAASGRRSSDALAPYAAALDARLGGTRWTPPLSRLVPRPLAAAIGSRLLDSRWFARHLLLDHWFLRSSHTTSAFRQRYGLRSIGAGG